MNAYPVPGCWEEYIKVLRRLNPGLIIVSYLLLLIFRFCFIILLFSIVEIWRGLIIAFVDDYPR